ncbi:MAG TPA: hypothetical protein VFC63_18085 [Blastocatellia bacterium]|nr:hypothetical protein [Blastocatellia bacterium]
MNSSFLELLKQVAGGVVIFEPFRRDSEGLREFQDKVARLQEMEHYGLIGRLFIEKRTRNGSEYIDFVMIQGGITAEGQHLLENLPQT